MKQLLSPALRARNPRKTVRRQRTKPKQRPRKISVIIPAHNEETYLRRTLASVRAQSYRRKEIIVVANGCTDRTEAVARGHCDRLVVLSQKGLGVARNLGARMATGQILVFLDADTIMERNALRMIARRFSTRSAAGTLKGRPDSRRAAFRGLYCLKNFMHRFILRKGSSGVIICWRHQFFRIGGFDEGLEVRENSELMRRLKRFGNYCYIGNATAITSMRRYEQRGLARTVWMWTRLWVRSLCGDLHQRKYEAVR